MKIQQFIELIENEHAQADVSTDEGKMTIYPRLTLRVDENAGTYEECYCGYIIEDEEGEAGVDDPSLDLDGALRELERMGGIAGGEVRVEGVNGYPSYEEYAEAREFAKIDMAGLLKRYLPVADGFSLTCPYNDGYGRLFPFGVYNISEENARSAIEGVEREMKERSRAVYDRIAPEDREVLPPFEELYGEICAECQSFAAKKQAFIRKHAGNLFFCDRFAEGKTAYTEPEELWHIYHNADIVRTCRYSVEQIKKNELSRPIDCELEDKYYAPLKGALERIDVTFFWHCTLSGTLSKVFYFKLTEDAVRWLEALRDDYDMKALEDLAFYSKGECIFSSCTHEGYHEGKKIQGE